MVDRFDRKTPPYLSSFELTRVLAHRAELLDRGKARPAVDPCGETDPLRIAAMELAAGRLDHLGILRAAPGGTTEEWNVSDLINLNLQPLLPRPAPKKWRSPAG